MRNFNSRRFTRFNRFFLCGLLGVLCTLTAVMLLSEFVVRTQTDNTVILDYQIKKLAHAETRDTVFIGDSSLGNGISTEVWDQETGHSSISLALTGLYGLPGSYNMLKRSLSLPRLKRVILVQSTDIMSREFSVVGFCKTLNFNTFEFRPDSMKMLFECFVSLNRTVDVLKGYAKSEIVGSQLTILDDYLAQGRDQYSNGKRSLNAGLTWVPQSNSRSAEYLRKIDDLCAAAKPVECIYMRGPVLSTLYRKNAREWDAFYQALFADLKHIRYFPEQITFAESDMGDSEAHVAPRHKAEATRVYAALFKAIHSTSRQTKLRSDHAAIRHKGL